MSYFIRFGLQLTLLLLMVVADSHALGRQVVRRDAFPVFNNPQMWSASEAETSQLVLPHDAVIGVAYCGEARAYPVSVMGVHELGNDTIAGLPIAVGW